MLVLKLLLYDLTFLLLNCYIDAKLTNLIYFLMADSWG